MKCYVITVGRRNELLLRRVLAPELERTNGSLIVTSQDERTGAWSLARTILVANRAPVAVCVGSLSVDPIAIEESRWFFEDGLGVAHRSLWHLALTIPDVLSLLFANRAILESLVGSVTDVQLLRGHYDPNVTLPELLKERGISDEEFDRRLAQADLTPLRQLSPVRELVEFVAQACANTGRLTNQTASCLGGYPLRAPARCCSFTR